MPALLESRLAVVAIIGVFLIPIAGSSLRGITHILTCREQVEAPFQIILEDGVPIVTGAQVLSAGGPTTLCGGLSVDVSVAVDDGGTVLVTVPIENLTTADWYGTVELAVAGIRLPIDLGRVPAGETVARTLELRLPPGTTELDGALLVGP